MVLISDFALELVLLGEPGGHLGAHLTIEVLLILLFHLLNTSRQQINRRLVLINLTILLLNQTLQLHDIRSQIRDHSITILQTHRQILNPLLILQILTTNEVVIFSQIGVIR